MHISWVLFGLSGLGSASVVRKHPVHEKRNGLPMAWKRHSKAPREAVLPVRIGLNQRNLEHGERYLMDIADPDSPNFGE